jgi:hypothetical protein
MNIAPSCSNCICWKVSTYSNYQGYCYLIPRMNIPQPFKGSGECCSEHHPIAVNVPWIGNEEERTEDPLGESAKLSREKMAADFLNMKKEIS